MKRKRIIASFSMRLGLTSNSNEREREKEEKQVQSIDTSVVLSFVCHLTKILILNKDLSKYFHDQAFELKHRRFAEIVRLTNDAAEDSPKRRENSLNGSIDSFYD